MSPAEQAAVAAVDWGSSHMRLWLLDRGGAVLAQRRTEQGMLSTPREHFADVLEESLQSLGAAAALPAIVCGMAGARQGWVEAAYLDVPTALADLAAGGVAPPDARRETWILPGLAQRDPERPDVMRGEETQLAGLEQVFDGSRHLVCMPGTHSKWVSVEGGRVASFGTWMTGELFSVLSRQSILRHSVAADGRSDPADPIFSEAVSEAIATSGGFGGSLFGLRAGSLLLDRSPSQGAARLSGLLVGAEIGDALKRYPGHRRVVLVGSGPLADLYSAALRLAACEVQIADAEEAVRRGLLRAARQRWPERFATGAVE